MNEQQTSNTSSDSGNVYAAPAARVDDVTPAGEMELAGRGTRLRRDHRWHHHDGHRVCHGDGDGDQSIFRPTVLHDKAGLALTNIVWYLIINWHFCPRTASPWGKKVMGIKIVRTDGSEGRCATDCRPRLVPIWVVSMIPFVGSLVAIVDCLHLPRKPQCLHDNIADTIVVQSIAPFMPA